MMRTYVDGERLIKFLRAEYDVGSDYKLISFVQGKYNWTARFTNGSMIIQQQGPLINVQPFLFEVKQ